LLTASPQNATVFWKPLVITPRADAAGLLRTALLELGCRQPHSLNQYPQPGTIAALAHQHGCNICFLDIAADREHAMQLAPEIAASIPVVGLSPPQDADLILRCLRLGMSEFVSDPGPEQVRNVLERFGRARAPLAERPTGCLYSVIPGKPGCGASSLAVHLAVQFGEGGATKVLLVDADPLTAGIAFMLKLRAGFHLGDVVRDWKRMDEDLWSRLRTTAWGIDLLLAPETPSTALDVGRDIAGELASFWRARYDIILVDTPDVATAATAGFAAVSDQILLVTTNELPALHAARRAIAYLDEYVRDRDKLRLIVNRYTPATGLKLDDLNTAIDLKPFAVLNNDYESLQAALLAGKPVGPTSPFGRSVSELSRRLRGGLIQTDLVAKCRATKKKSIPWLGFRQSKTKSEWPSV
jgi:pilus assembly protein CpaE